MPFLIIFVVIPLIELGIFAAVSDHIGLGTALLFALLTAILGGNLVRMQGMQTIMSMRGSMDQGQMPVNELFDGFCIVAAGALLITPGFLTDAIGFSLLVPQFRSFMRNIIKKHTSWAMEAHSFSPGRPYDPNIIEGEYENLDEESPDQHDKRLPKVPQKRILRPLIDILTNRVFKHD